MPNFKDFLFPLSVGIVVLTFLWLFVKILSVLFPNKIETPHDSSGNLSIPSGDKPIETKCRQGFEKRGKLCIKNCIEHPSLYNLHQKPKPNNKFSEFSDLERWENVDPLVEYCYFCPPGYNRRWDAAEQKMKCISKCPPGMANNVVADTCYRGFPLCSNLPEEDCAKLECPPGFERQTNMLSEVMCIDPKISCPEGRENSDYLGCWKDNIEAVISTLEDPYLLSIS